MSIAAKLGNLFRRFRREQRGTVAIIAAISFIPMLGMAGAAVDFIRAANVKSQLQNALDAGALAAAGSRTLNTSDRIKVAEAAFAKNWPDPITRNLAAVPTFEVNGDQVKGSAEVAVPTTIMRVVGIDSMPVSGEVNVNIPQGKKAEIVLVLDYSGSMQETSGGQVKWVAMKNAAKKLVNDLETMGPSRVKFGLVPFSHHVWVTLPKSFVRGQSGSGNWTGCTQDRPYPANLTDDTPTSSNTTKWGQPQAPTPAGDPPHGGCGAYVPNNLTVLPLTTDFTSVKAQLDAMRPYAYTHIALGAEFGWHLLSPNAPFTGGSDYDDDSTEKVLVLLTDGRQTEPAFGPGSTRTVRQGERNLESLCGNIKGTGITVMTIAFDLRDEDTKDRLRDCASDPYKHFFDADTGADVAVAFEQIKTQITAQAYLSK
jgi:Flp pilus assembly protein TadG